MNCIFPPQLAAVFNKNKTFQTYSHAQHNMTDKVSPTLRKKVSHQAVEEPTMLFMSWWRPKKSYKESKAASKCPKGLDWPLAVQAHNLSCPQGISSGFSEDSQRVCLRSNTHHDMVIMYVGVKVIEASKLIFFSQTSGLCISGILACRSQALADSRWWQWIGHDWSPRGFSLQESQRFACSPSGIILIRWQKHS